MKHLAELIKTSTITVTAGKISATGCATLFAFGIVVMLIIYDKI